MIKNDKWIAEKGKQGMILPFQDKLIRHIENRRDQILVPTISYGLSSFGYDIRLSPKEFKIFRHIPGQIVDPKFFSPKNLESVALKTSLHGDYFILPGHSYGLGVALEYLNIPEYITVLCIGKSTYARCFTGDTKVKLVNGDFNFIELIEKVEQGERLYGYGINNGQIEVQELIQPRLIEMSNIVRVYLDNNQYVDCTPDHKFLLRNGEKIAAGNLKSGMSLHPIYEYKDKNYPVIFDSVYASLQKNRQKAFSVVHRMVARDILNADPAWHIHHLDGDVENNHPSNIVLLTASEHAIIHNQENSHAQLGGQAFKKKWESNPEFREHIMSQLHSAESKAKQQLAIREYNNSEQNKQKLEQARAERWNSSSERLKQSEVAKQGMAALKRRDDITENTLTMALLEAGTIRGAANLLKVDRSAFRRFPEVMRQFKEGNLGYNHKVLQVEELTTQQPVYCLTAPKTGNFALSAGVFVENCGIIANVTPAEAGWRGHLTIELSNSSSADCRIYVNEGIVQLLFFEGEPCKTSYAARQGKYQDQPESVVVAKAG